MSDLWKPEPPFTLRELVSYTIGLPSDAWTWKWAHNSPYDLKDEMNAIIIDLLIQNIFQTKIAASAMAGKDYAKVNAKAPKPMKRPTLRPEPKPPKQFIKTSDLKRMLESKKVTVHHTPECIQSRINEGGQKLNCNCPRR